MAAETLVERGGLTNYTTSLPGGYSDACALDSDMRKPGLTVVVLLLLHPSKAVINI